MELIELLKECRKELIAGWMVGERHPLIPRIDAAIESIENAAVPNPDLIALTKASLGIKSPVE